MRTSQIDFYFIFKRISSGDKSLARGEYKVRLRKACALAELIFIAFLSKLVILLLKDSLTVEGICDFDSGT